MLPWKPVQQPAVLKIQVDCGQFIVLLSYLSPCVHVYKVRLGLKSGNEHKLQLYFLTEQPIQCIPMVSVVFNSWSGPKGNRYGDQT